MTDYTTSNFLTKSNHRALQHSITFTDLETEPVWVAWSGNKVPINPHTGKAASTADPSTWGTYHEACNCGDGVGFVFRQGGGIIGIDLDGVVTWPDEGGREAIEVPDWVAEILDLNETFIEFSPSGTGLHVYILGDHETVTAANPDASAGTKRQAIEIYSSGRYFRCTFVSARDGGTQIVGQAPRTMQIIHRQLAEWCGSEPVQRTKDEREYRPATRAQVESALRHLDPDMRYDEWRDIGFAIHNNFEGSDDGFDVFEEWSSAGRSFKPGDCERIWRSAEKKHEHPNPVTIGTLLGRAKEAGWTWREGQEEQQRLAIAAARDVLAEIQARAKKGAGAQAPMSEPAPASKPTAAAISTKNRDYSDLPASVTLVAEALTTQPHWAGRLRHNVFSNELEIDGRPVIDADVIAALMWCEGAFKSVSKAKVQDAFEFACRANPFDPVVTYLDGLAWDGVPRLDTWLATYCNAEATRYTAVVGACWLIAAVARQFKPGAKVDTVLVLEGEQGVGKSLALATLAGRPAWFCDTLPDLGSRDAMQALAGRWIVEIAELAALKRSDVETLKAFLTVTTDKYRAPYGRHPVIQPRRAVFAGTTNDNTYLADSTGNRRFWPVTVGTVDIEGLARDRDQLWAEAVVAYRAGRPWVLSPEEQALAKAEQEERVIEDAWEGPIANWLEGQTETCAKAIFDGIPALCPLEKRGTATGRRIGAILRQLGWRQVGTVSSRKSLYYRQRLWVRDDGGGAN